MGLQLHATPSALRGPGILALNNIEDLRITGGVYGFKASVVLSGGFESEHAQGV